VLLPSLLTIVAVLFGVLSLAFFVAGVRAAGRRRVFGLMANTTLALLFFAVAALLATISIATRGYRALTHEEEAAVVRTTPLGSGRFIARFSFPDGRQREYHLAGDELYVDAHILKWKSIANLLGLHTAYELDRVSGRYAKLEDEQVNERTVFSLAREKPLDMFGLRRRYPILRPLVDAEYGSATFITADHPVEYRVLVSTTGLLIRRSEP
jgi:hypothetical protein